MSRIVPAGQGRDHRGLRAVFCRERGVEKLRERIALPAAPRLDIASNGLRALRDLCRGLLVLLVLAMLPASGDVFVAPDGNDANSGTEEAPFATVAKAREAVREQITAGAAGEVTVFLRNGVYTLSEPLAFSSKDSGPAMGRVVYAAWPGEKPVLSGGRPITGWKKAEGNRWVVELPEVKAGTWRFRDLYADGMRLTRGRYPNGDGLLRVKSVNPEATLIELDQAPEGVDLTGVELVMYQNWSISRVLVKSADGAKLTMQNPVGWMGHGDATTASPEKPCILENALAFVDQPGEWYLDTTNGVLTYQAAENEDPNARSFIAPALDRLLSVEGRPDAPVRNIVFRGLAFEYTSWVLPEFGYLGIQAGHHGTRVEDPTYVLPAALFFARAEGCALENCRVARTGACGIAFGGRCRDNRVSRCELDDIGGNGVVVGWRGNVMTGQLSFVGDESLSSDWANPEDVPQGNRVTDCTISRCGAVCHGSVGVFAAFSAGTEISHNLIHDMPYTGISVGFRWNTTETSQREALVAHNHVYDVMKMLADGGAIYTLGYQPGTVLRGNRLHQVHRSGFAHGGAPNNGIFFDEGSSGFLVLDNVIYDTSGDPIRFNQTREENLVWKTNYFGVSPEDPQFPKEIADQAGPRAE